MKISYYICGPLSQSNDPTYWNMDKKEWIEDFFLATPFTSDILTSDTLPPQTITITKFSVEGQPLARHTPHRGTPIENF